MSEPFRGELPGGASLLSGDAIIALRLLDEALAAPLIAFAVLGTAVGPLLGGSFRAVKAETARVRAVLGSRYGA